jgi:hypothetical protein
MEKPVEMKRSRAWGLLAVFLFGLLLWVAGALNVFGDHHLLTLCALLAGGLLAASAGLVLLGTPASGLLGYGREEVVWFCGTFGIGLAAIGCAISPITSWLWPGLLFALGGVFLMAWASQALRRRD